MKYLGAILNLVSGSFSVLGFVKRVILEKTLITENNKLSKLNRNAMNFLLWWSFGNIIISGIMLFFSFGMVFYFFEMNLAWSVITAIIAFVTYKNLSKDTSEEVTMWSFFERVSGLQKILSFSTGLDVAYIVCGAFLIDRGFLTSSIMFVGFGATILFQGLILIVFDAVLYLLNRNTTQNVLVVLKESSEA